MRWRSVLLLSVAGWGCASPTGDPQVDEQVASRLSSILADSAAANGAIGSQGAVRIPGYQPWSSVTGLNGLTDSMRADLMIGTGSISKMIAAVAALRLIDRGVLHFNDTLGKWFPNLPNVDPAITLERVLHNTSGLRDYSEAPNYGQIIFADLQRTWQPAELLAFIGPPLFPPGTRWNASNTNRLLLDIIVERESGQSLGSFFRQELWQGLTATWLPGDGPAPGALAQQWSVDPSGNRTNYTQDVFGPALFSSRLEVQSSAGDLAAFAERLFGGSLLTPATQAAMLTFVPDDGGIAGQTGGGLGPRRFNYLGRTLWGHSGGTANSSAMILFDPATGISVAVSVNQDGPSQRQSHFRTAQALLKEAIAVVASRTSPPQLH